MKRLKWIAVAFAAAMALLAMVPLFVTLDDYVPQIEAALSEKLGERVRISALRAAALPVPHVTVTGIAIGTSGAVKVGKVSVAPDLWSLLGDTIVIRSIEIDQLELTQEGIERMPVWTTGSPDAPSGRPSIRVAEIRLDKAQVRLERTTIGPFDVRIRLTPNGRPAAASFRMEDDRLKARLTPEGERFRIHVSAKDWTVPVGPALLFDELEATGTASLEAAEFSAIEAKLYGGAVIGRLTVAWGERVGIEGEGEVSDLAIAPVLQALQRPPTLSGRLTARPVTFSAAAATPAGLADALRLVTPFDVQNGVLNGVDVGKAATSLVGRDGGGGETRFDVLSGHLAMDRGTRRITRLRVASGSLSADGHVTISRSDELNGRINANVKATRLASATMPLNVSGTLDAPRLLPTRGTVAGAAVGTAILGPGVGTTIGSKIGQWTEGLFGSGEEPR